MKDENKQMKKLAVKCMVLSVAGLSILLLICIFGPGSIQYLRNPVFQVLLVAGTLTFAVGLIGFVLAYRIGREEH